MTSVSIHQLRRRIRSTRSLAQVTRAMQTVAASKLRKVQQLVTQAQPYDQWSRHFLERLGAGSREAAVSQPLLRQPSAVNNILIVAVTSDRGLCGAYNQSVIREALLFIRGRPEKHIAFATVGRKGQQILARLGYPLLAHFELPRAGADFKIATAIARLTMEEFLNNHFQEVHLVYTHYRNILMHPVRVERFLPLALGLSPKSAASASPAPQETPDFAFEPSPAAVLEEFLPRTLEARIYHALLESATSEQAARMVAMENASRNAEDMVKELTVDYNKARQLRITREILDIASGAEALNQD